VDVSNEERELCRDMIDFLEALKRDVPFNEAAKQKIDSKLEDLRDRFKDEEHEESD